MLAEIRQKSTLKKRLQRARKFVCLVDLLGVGILHAAPMVSVSRLDSIGLKELKRLECNPEDGPNIKAIAVRWQIPSGDSVSTSHGES